MSLRRFALAVVALAACRDDDGPSKSTEDDDPRLPIMALTVPDLGCAEPVASRGECARDADCGSASCVLDPGTPTRDRETPPLSCGPSVGTLKERDRCQEGAECESGLCALAGVCVKPCAAHKDCARGQLCQPIEVRVDDGLAPVMACTRALAFPEDVRVAEPARVEALNPDEVRSVITGGSRGTSLLYVKPACEVRAAVVSLRSRSTGEELFNLLDLFNGKSSLNPVPPLGDGALLAALVPNNPVVQGSDKGYELGLAVEMETSADVVVASRTNEGRTLDLNVFYVGGGELEKEGGYHPGEPAIAKLLSELGERYEKIGIQLGVVREYDVTGALREELSVIENDARYDEFGRAVDLELVGIEQLFQLSRGVDDGGLNLFLVSDMGAVLGISGGIPGALGVHGTTASGIAVALDVADVPLLNVIMHEMSHQMGLFHTTESNGAVLDPIADTPVCGLARDTNGDGRLDPHECKGSGADNLMFWAGTGTTLSRQQQQVLRRSLILR